MLDDRALTAMAEELVTVSGVRAVTLGGSRARGTHRPDSDVDLGLYYTPGELDLAALTRLAKTWTGEDTAVAGPDGWGPWVDGGAWLSVEGTAVDWILRDADRVREQCRRAQAGEFAFHTQPGHPLGFLDVAYAGEVSSAVPLADPHGLLADLRALVTPYPEALRDAMLGALWQVDFLLDGARKGPKRADASYTAICASHAVLLVAHAWHAAAGVWAINEKNLAPAVATLNIDSGGFADYVRDALAHLGGRPDELAATLDRLSAMPRPDRDRDPQRPTGASER